MVAQFPTIKYTDNANPVRFDYLQARDQGYTITVDKSGNVTGLDKLPAFTRSEIAQVLLSGTIERPIVLKELFGDDSTPRASNRDQSLKLISPARTVIVSDRPTFRWESISGANSYTVYIIDASGQIVARSNSLKPDHSEWLVPKPLNRGEVYAWIVTAVVDGKEITSPGSSAPEMKFQVLSSANLGQLSQLKRARSHLALGIFYAQIGMIAEADLHFQILVHQNPDSSQARKLLTEVRGLRFH